MTRDILIKKTVDNITKLPDHKIQEVSDFTEFLLGRIENDLMLQGIQQLVMQSKTFQFLEEDETFYSIDDLKERYQ